MQPARMLVALLLLPLVAAPSPSSAPRQVYQLLVNPGLERYDQPYDEYEGVACQVASGWQRFWQGDDEPGWMDVRVFAASPLGTGHVEKFEGETAQLLVSTAPYDAGVMQQVGGLIPGAGYGFHAAMLTIFQTSSPPAVHDTMFKQVGIDPTGGTDPESPAIVWSPPDGHDEGPFDVDSITAAYAEAPTVTVFARVDSPYPSGGLPLLNLSWFDSAILARTASVSAVSPPRSETLQFVVRWDNAVPAPGGSIVWYDVEWLDEAEGVWHDWLTWTAAEQAVFAGEWGHAYHFRARAWQKYSNGAHLFSPYRPQGDTRTAVAGPTLAGRVLSPAGLPLAGATVAVSGTTYAATSDAAGRLELALPVITPTLTLTASRPGWLAPPPVYGLAPGPTETLTLTWMLVPPGDAVANGDFEAGLVGWSLRPGAVLTTSPPAHSGRVALVLGGSPSLPLTTSVGLSLAPSLPLTTSVGLSQTVVLTAAWDPVLAFWYRPALSGTDDTLEVVLTTVTETLVVSGTLPARSALQAAAALTFPVTSTVTVTTTRLFTPALDTAGWHLFWCRPGPPETALTATVTIEFRLWDGAGGVPAVVSLDEVRLGPSARQPAKIYIYLPLVHRRQ